MTDLQPRTLLPATLERPDAQAVWTPSRSFTWAELEERSRRVANGLVAEGIGPLESWGLLARNTVEWAELSIGNGRAGARYVPLNWHLTVPELTELLLDSGSKLLVCSAELEVHGRPAAAAAGIDTVIVLGEPYEAWLASMPDDPLPDGPLGVPMQYTGGTTGRSKGVIRSDTQATASRMAAAMSAWGTLVGMPTDSHALLCTPAYHAVGGALLRTALARGNDLAILDGWDPETVLSTIEARHIGATVMVPTQFIRLLKEDVATRTRHDLSSLQWVLHTAAPCPAWVKHEMIDWFGPVIVELYGSSEGIGPVIATSTEWLERPGTVGKATAALELFVVDENGDDLPPGEIGTIYAKRRDGTPTYHGDPEKTAAMVRADGRFTVGDLGWLDDDGFLFLADRRVDLILSGGTNIYPAEIEAALSRHPEVADVAVFGIPHPEWGQEIKAVVEPVSGRSPTADELIDFLRGDLASFKLPRSIDIVESLPRESSGKLRKHLLRNPYWE